MPRKDSMRGRKSRFSAAGAIKRRFYQHIRAASKQMPFGRPCPSRTKNLERFQAKWTPIRVKKTRQIKESRAPLRFYRSGKGSSTTESEGRRSLDLRIKYEEHSHC